MSVGTEGYISELHRANAGLVEQLAQARQREAELQHQNDVLTEENGAVHRKNTLLEQERDQLRASIDNAVKEVTERSIYIIRLELEKTQLAADLETAREANSRALEVLEERSNDVARMDEVGRLNVAIGRIDKAKQALAQITREETVEARSH